MKGSEKEKTIDSKYIQQHLANERTFLAWIRTAIAVIGLGFISVGVVHQLDVFSTTSKTIATVAGVSSVIFGGIVLIMAAYDYTNKRKGINTETFRAPINIVLLFTGGMVLVEILLIVLVLLLVF